MGDLIGSAEFELRARREQLKKDISAAERDLQQGTGRMERDAEQSVTRAVGRTGGIAKALAVTLTAVFAAALTGAFALGRASLKMADDMSDASRRIGVSTSVLQEYQNVARQTGENADQVAGSLERFMNKVAASAAGLDKEGLKIFTALGLGPEELRNFESAEQAIDTVIDRIGDLESAADRAAVANKLELGPLATALQDGSDEVARLRDEAYDLGLVMDESMIKKGAEASEKLEILSQVIGIQMAEAFINLSDEVLAFVGHIGTAIKGLNDFIERFQRFDSVTSPAFGNNFAFNLGIGNLGGMVAQGWRQRLSDPTGVNGFRAAGAAAKGPFVPIVREKANPFRSEGEGPAELEFPDRPRRQRAAPVDRTAEREARRSERVEQEIARARERLLDVVNEENLTAQQRFDLAQDRLTLEREARDAEIESKEGRGELKGLERQNLENAHREADALEDRVLADNAFRELQDERLANERLLADLSADLISIQVGAARTAEERGRLELQLLEITQRQRREALQQELDRNPKLTQAQRNDALGTLGRIEQGERDATNRRNMGPLDQWRDQSLKSAAEVSEAFEAIAARGLDSLNEGIVDAIMNTRDLGETFSNVAKQILADILNIQVRQSITEPLSRALFGGSEKGSGGKGLIGSGLSSLGSFFNGKIAGLSIPGVSSALSVGGGDAPITKVIIEPSPYFDAHVAGIAGPLANQAGSQAVSVATSIARRAAGAVQQRLQRLGTP